MSFYKKPVRRGAWKPPTNSPDVRSTGDSVDLQLASAGGTEASLNPGILRVSHVASVRTELNGRKPSQRQRIAWYGNTKTQTWKLGAKS